MCEYFKNNPIAVRYCLLYKFLQEESIEESFEGFCKVVGNDVTDFENFKFWFNRFAEGRFDDEESKNLLELVQNDKYAIRVCILYEWQRDQHIPFYKRLFSSLSLYSGNVKSRLWNVYENLCNVFGDDVIKYPEVDFWYYRFTDGHFDLDFERDPEKKILELGDMPLDVMEEIVKKLNFCDRCTSRKVSQKLRNLIDTCEYSVDWFIIEMNEQWITIRCDYSRNNVFRYMMNDLEFALNDSKILLKNPKFKFKKLEVTLGSFSAENLSKFCSEIDGMFNSFDSRIHVEELLINIKEKDPIASILPYLKAGILKKIHLKGEIDEISEEMMQFEQWKQAVEIKIEKFSFDFFPIKILSNFEKIEISCGKFEVEDLNEIIEVLMTSSRIESWKTIDASGWGFFVDELRSELGKPIPNKPNIFHLPIPDSEEFFELKLCSHQISINRKS